MFTTWGTEKQIVPYLFNQLILSGKEGISDTGNDMHKSQICYANVLKKLATNDCILYNTIYMQLITKKQSYGDRKQATKY